MSQMPSYGPTPIENFYVYYEDDTDQFAVHWRGNEWGTDHHADLRGWYHDPLSQEGYRYLLQHYQLPEAEYCLEQVGKMPPAELDAARYRSRVHRGSK